MSHPNVFISYNPNSEAEQTLAIRLHTIGAVNGFNMMLPDRSFGSKTLSAETTNRIRLSDYFIVFSTSELSEVVRQEIRIAFEKHRDRSKILVIYDRRNGKNQADLESCTEIMIDTNDPADKIFAQIANRLKTGQPSKDDGGIMAVLGSILLIGVGLFALTELFADEPRRPKRKPQPRSKKRKANA